MNLNKIIDKKSYPKPIGQSDVFILSVIIILTVFVSLLSNAESYLFKFYYFNLDKNAWSEVFIYFAIMVTLSIFIYFNPKKITYKDKDYLFAMQIIFTLFVTSIISISYIIGFIWKNVPSKNFMDLSFQVYLTLTASLSILIRNILNYRTYSLSPKKQELFMMESFQDDKRSIRNTTYDLFLTVIVYFLLMRFIKTDFTNFITISFSFVLFIKFLMVKFYRFIRNVHNY
ncbi:hypothetical protein A2Z22_03245 [Candidatus Woesebacteria bacterium RBG_16_34_12]|uniref:Uncharacterized protein n=1 Tax=Candidatus Woesebacteria bacterium RBG_16_34_12 TaxID=1802480 RepID=A0A1F7XAP8_9BACT|nr:MAG: hypothetical protein A2Z22_03245 [Candidatus Woesebacteria bacterium RBG_16_34_12]